MVHYASERPGFLLAVYSVLILLFGLTAPTIVASLRNQPSGALAGGADSPEPGA
jgi:hypothetical protein